MTVRSAISPRPGAASGRGDVAPFHVMRVLEAAQVRRRTGRPVYDLSAGQPSGSAPAPVLAAARRALDGDRIGYTAAVGIPALRHAVAAHCARWYGVEVDRAQVAITTGSSGGFLLAFLAAFDAGDAVALVRPGYPAYRNMLRALGCRVVDLTCDAGTGYLPTVAALDALSEPPAGLVVASPANPTGSMLTATQLAELVRWCDAHGTRLVSDEIYHGVCFDRAAASAWQTSSQPIVVNSFSKYFSMTGWRIGWLLVPDELQDAVDRLAGNFALCPPTLSQLAAVHAFDSYADLDRNVARYRTSRDLLLDRLPAMGLRDLAPADGAFYVYADVSRYTHDALSWVSRLLDETGVAIAPGVDFDQVDGGHFVRMSYAGDPAEIAAGVDVLGNWLAEQHSAR